MEKSGIIKIRDLGFQWETNNPFLFCVHHEDHYPRGDGKMGPDDRLDGRSLGNDFTPKDGWRMYHGMKIPGFPMHPHRGFETVTIVLKGLVDHSDSMGASGRYGPGDVQWMTAGAGMQHAEMFPLIHSDRENPLELFQIWLNLPADKKFVKPYYKMLWKEDIPVLKQQDEKGRTCEVRIIAGSLDGVNAKEPAPDSWAAREENEVAIWIIKLDAFATWELPQAYDQVLRSIYFYRGSGIVVSGRKIPSKKAIDLIPAGKVMIENGPDVAYLLLLQGMPINQPVVQYGPFVMNTREEIQQAFDDYRKTQYGGWPWPAPDHVHDPNRGRFARYTNGEEEIRE
jgi:redox-sensitive bicupin YhaK (pirin superfamily)